MTEEEISKLTNRELHSVAQEYGGNARKWTKKFAALLPEIEKRSMYKQFGFYSIYEYAAKICGMSNATVDEVLNVHRKLEDKPVLKNLITEHGWTKLKIVATSATPENQNFWAKKVKEMSKATLETFVKELRKDQSECRTGSAQAGLMSGQIVNETAHEAQTAIFTDSADVSSFSPGISKPMAASQKTTFAFKLDDQTETKFRIFKQRLEKKTGEPKDWNKVMKELLAIAAQHENCGKRSKKKAVPSTGSSMQTPPGTGAPEQPANDSAPDLKTMLEQIKKSLPTASKRHIPALVKKYLQLKYGGKCGFPECKNPADIDHHLRRFALVPNHDPDYIVPLCKNHERLVHHGLIQNEESPPKNWKIRLESDKNSPKYAIDLKVQGYRAPR